MKTSGNWLTVQLGRHSEDCAEFRVRELQAVFGSRVHFCWGDGGLIITADQAEDLALALIVAAGKARELAVEPQTCFLPLVESFELENSARL